MEFTFTFEDAKTKVKVDPMNYRKKIGQPIIFDTILDFSPSMAKFFGEMVNCYNEIMVPALQGASEECKKSMFLGCLLFSRKLVPGWEGFRNPDNLGNQPLPKNIFKKPGLNDGTALYGAMRAGVLWTAAAMDHIRSTGRGEIALGKVIVLTDGANNLDPKNESAVTNAIDSIGRNSKNLQRVIGYFNTVQGLTESEFRSMAAKTGFTGLGFYDIAKGGTIEDQRKSFRHFFKIFSSQAAVLQ